MIKLRSELTKLLKLYHPTIYYQTAPSTATFPYIIYNFPPSFTIEEMEVFPLDIDVWDNRTDTTELETLAEALWKGLNKHQHIDESIQFRILKESRLPELDETDIGIRRRKLIFQLRYYDRTL